ncbi:MAG: alpha/beta hydrolase [Syntrophomonadaceae bacterium]
MPIGKSPFIIRGHSNTALLFIHGFTATPSEVLPTAQLIHQMNGCTVRGMLLPGHGTSPRELNQTTWQNWADAAAEECKNLQKEYPRVFIGGLSLGGLLAIYCGLSNPELKGIITINAPIFIRFFPVLAALAPLLKYLCPYVPKINWQHQLRMQEMGRFAYPCNPVAAFLQMQELRHTVVDKLGEVKLPILVVQSLKDETIMKKSGDYLAGKITGAPVTMVKLQNSPHVATMGQEKVLLAEKIACFIKKEGEP